MSNVQQFWPQMVEENRLSGFQVAHSPIAISTTKELIVFVHGWRLTPDDYFNFSETMFKRLYWQGFQGRFAAPFWPTLSRSTEILPGLEFLTFNRSEQIALKSGPGMAAYLQSLRQRFPDYMISVCSHSQGTAVVTEALKQLAGMGSAPIDNWVLMQSAFPAQVFDTSVPNLQPFLTVEQSVPTPNLYHGYGAGITNAVRGSVVNFFNPKDFALSLLSYDEGNLGGGGWEINNAYHGDGPITMKPNTYLGYYSDGSSSLLRTNEYNQNPLSLLYGGYYNGPARTVTNTHELLPFVVRSRTKAVGAQVGVGGILRPARELNLEGLGFTGQWRDHSGV